MIGLLFDTSETGTVNLTWKMGAVEETLLFLIPFVEDLLWTWNEK
jgi:hypothetical protein